MPKFNLNSVSVELSAAQCVAAWNATCYPEDMIFSMERFDEVNAEAKPSELAAALSAGCVHLDDKWFYYRNGFPEGLFSFNDLDDQWCPFSAKDIAAAIVEIAEDAIEGFLSDGKGK